MSCCLPGAAGYPNAGSGSLLPPPAMPSLLDGAIELLDLLPQPLCLVLQGRPLLLQLADVLGCLLQGGGLADLRGRRVRRQREPLGWAGRGVHGASCSGAGGARCHVPCCRALAASATGSRAQTTLARLHHAGLHVPGVGWQEPRALGQTRDAASPGDTPCPCMPTAGRSAQPWVLTLMLGWALSVLTRLCSVSKPSLILKRLFCSAEMCVMRRLSICG